MIDIRKGILSTYKEKNKILLFSTTWLDVEGVKVSAISREGQMLSDHIHMWYIMKENKETGNAH